MVREKSDLDSKGEMHFYHLTLSEWPSAIYSNLRRFLADVKSISTQSSSTRSESDFLLLTTAIFTTL
jgi:hypothetical protein